MSKEEQQQHITSIGGQAVMEGVMMRGPFKTAVAVRKPDGDIECKVEENGTKTRKKFWRLPIIRGCVSFVDSLVIGMKALMFSAEFVDIEEEEGTESKFDKWLDDKFGDKVKDLCINRNIACIQYCFVYGTSYFSYERCGKNRYTYSANFGIYRFTLIYKPF